MGVVQTFVHQVAPPCKCAIVGEYMFTFVTTKYVYLLSKYRSILYSNKRIHILNPLNELYQSIQVSMQSEQLWKMTKVPICERLIYITMVNPVIYLVTTLHFFAHLIEQ